MFYLLLWLTLFSETPKNKNFNSKIDRIQFLESDSVLFSQDVFPIFFRTCAAIECHGRNQPPLFLTHNKIQKYSDRIKVRINDKANTMPPIASGKKLSIYELDTINQWIDQGCPNN